MADEADKPLKLGNGDQRIASRQRDIGKLRGAVPSDAGADEAAELKLEMVGDQRQPARGAAAIAPDVVGPALRPVGEQTKEPLIS
jgi:hypothetical protein